MGFLFGFSWQQDGWCQIHGQQNGQLGDVMYFKIKQGSAARPPVRSDGSSCSLLEKKNYSFNNRIFKNEQPTTNFWMLFTNSNCGGKKSVIRCWKGSSWLLERQEVVSC
jgi:hypothetical protein